MWFFSEKWVYGCSLHYSSTISYTQELGKNTGKDNWYQSYKNKSTAVWV